MEELAVVGKRVPQVDSLAKATGRAEFTTDITLPGMLYGKILRSPYPHARIIRIDTSRALKLPGVGAVITGQDTPKRKYGLFPDEYCLAVDKVRFIGDEVAAVAAVSEDVATEALSLIDVKYEELPAVFDPREAMKSGAPQIHEGVPNNVSLAPAFHWGNIEVGFAESEYVREDTFSSQAVTHCALEVHGAVANYEPSGELTVWSSTQGPYTMSKALAHTLDIPLGRVRVIKPHVGGGFGGKHDQHSCDFVAALLSMKTGRPVKLIYDREEVFLATRQRHPMIVTIKTGAKRDGTMMAKECTVIADGGAYNSLGPIIVSKAGTKLCTIYRIPHVRFQGYHVYTNHPVGGPFRGFGQVQLRFADECQLDMIAEDLGLDPVELRTKNAVPPGYVTPNKFKITSCGFRECVEKAAEMVKWREKREKKVPYRGVGMGCNDYVSGSRNFDQPDSSTAFVKIAENGSVTVLTGASDIGQSSNTTLCMLAAEELGVPLDDVRIVAADTKLTPPDMATFASRVTFVAGKAVVAAAADAKHQLFEVVADSLEAHPNDLEMKDRRIFVKGSPEKGVDLAKAVWMSVQAGHGSNVLGRGYYAPETDEPNWKTSEGNLSPAYSFGAQAVEVEVEPDTGEVRVLDVFAAYDCGRAVNPLALEGQVEGSIMGGIGQALYEERLLENGLTLNPSLLTYGIPTALEAPAIQTAFVETIDPEGPFGAKGMSEGAQVPLPCAIANAVYDAIGVRITDLPITPDKVLKALEEKNKKS